jgi:demethylmenaquinone methyltransferase / 2-methoxy-6-polyprenyl-1,4-benzoquinol methylase
MKKPPIGQAEGKKEDIEQMFDTIAPTYDLLNRGFSLGIDTIWRKNVVKRLKALKAESILDVATGTADLAIAAAEAAPKEIIGVDIAEQMLVVGRKKVAAKGLSDKITLKQGDSLQLPFEDQRFDAITVSFGVRNFENLQKGLQEMHRVLKPNGTLMVLEFSQVKSPIIRPFYLFYFKHFVPFIGGLISGSRTAYEYLPESVDIFPSGENFLAELRRAGYSSVKQSPQTFGIATLYEAKK